MVGGITSIDQFRTGTGLAHIAAQTQRAKGESNMDVVVALSFLVSAAVIFLLVRSLWPE